MDLASKRKRIYEYDFVRVTAILAVIMIHSIAPVVSDKTADLSSMTWLAANLLDALSRWCVPVFIMLSGALLIKDNFDLANTKRFYRSKLVKIAVPFMIWSVVYLAWYAAFESARPWPDDIKQGIKNFLLGSPSGVHLYFILVIIGLYAITPLLSIIVAKLSRRGVLLISLTILLATTISYMITDYLSSAGGTTMITRPIPFIGYYVFGYAISRYYATGLRRVVYWAAGTAFVAFSLLIWVATYAISIKEGSFVGTYYSYLSPTVMMQSMSALVVLLAAAKLVDRSNLIQKLVGVEYRSAIAMLSGLVFAVYFVHLLIMNIFRYEFKDYMSNSNKIESALVVFFVTVVISFMLAYGYSWLVLISKRLTSR